MRVRCVVLLVVLGVATACSEPPATDELAPPAGVRTPLPPADVTRKGCSPATTGEPATSNPGPVIEVALGSNGALVEATIQRSSGHAEIDAAALQILRMASPFEPFPPALARRYGAVRFAYQWEFSGGCLQPGTVTAGADAADSP